DGPSTINIEGNLRLGDSSVFGPVSGTDVIQVNVGGRFIRFGRTATAAMALFAPNAQIRFGKGFFGRGSFVGAEVGSDKAVMVGPQTTTTSTTPSTTEPVTTTSTTSSTSTTLHSTTTTTSSTSTTSSTYPGTSTSTSSSTSTSTTSTTTTTSSTSS